MINKPDLSNSIYTKRFELIPLGRWETLKQLRIIEADAELRAMLFHREKPISFLKTLLKSKRKKIPKRLHHRIVVRETGKTIGLHSVHLVKYNTASLFVAITDRTWWGKNVVVEIRKKILVEYHAATQVNQFSSDVYSRNFASILNYKKLGFENVGIKYSCKYDPFTSKSIDYLMFSLREEQLLQQIATWKNADE